MVREGSSFVGKGITTVTGGVFRVEGGGAVTLQEALSLQNARIEASGSGSGFSVSEDVTARGTNVTFSATDGASITVPRLSAQNVVVEGALNYTRIYTEVTGDELVFTNATVSGTRIEMTEASTIRLYNTHLTIPSGIFMMGDASGGNAGNNANERHVYVGGTDTWDSRRNIPCSTCRGLLLRAAGMSASRSRSIRSSWGRAGPTGCSAPRRTTRAIRQASTGSTIPTSSLSTSPSAKSCISA